MIAILMTVAVLGQTDAFSQGAKIRMEANRMIMGMQGVPYDVADVLNGSNYSVEEATAIAAQRRAAAEIRLMANMRKAEKEFHDISKKAFKQWVELNKFYDKIADGSFVLPDQERPTAREHIRNDIAATSEYLKPAFGAFNPSRGMRNAAKMHIKKAEAALAVLDKQGSPPEEKK